ncbi:MAG: hypothetical protein ACRCV9_10105 [Burkholderiaceae bacterium]
MDADIYFDFAAATELRPGAVAAFRAIGALDFEERETTNYINEQYFYASVGKVQYEVALADDEDAGGMRFWLAIEHGSGSLDRSEFESLVNATADKLKACGARVARVHDLGKKTMRLLYL